MQAIFISVAMQWFAARMREPSTYSGAAILAGVLGEKFLGSAVVGQHALEVGLAVAGAIQVATAQVGKKEVREEADSAARKAVAELRQPPAPATGGKRHPAPEQYAP